MTPGFFATLGLPILEGRDFNDADVPASAQVAIVSQTVATRMFPRGDALNHYITWTDPLLRDVPLFKMQPMRIVGIVPDMDDTDLVPKPTMTLYRPFQQEQAMGGGRLFIHVSSDPYGLVAPVTHLLRQMSADQPVEHAATLEDIRTEVLSSDRLNVIVFSAFAAVALLIAVVGIAGVLAFSVSGRTREFGIRLAIGSQPSDLLADVVKQGAAMAGVGLIVGIACGFGLAHVAGAFLSDLKTPGVLPVAGAALLLLLSAIIASLIPAARAARIEVLKALRVD